ncbi:MAG: hypothetical protein U5R48_11950 [Gammaproteobacteria bacterium]|nr:hypothetical protein [Gammaproteobacteria bacterium]
MPTLVRDFALGKLTFQDPANPTPASVQRVDMTYVNGPDIQTDGIDYALTWDLPTDGAGMFRRWGRRHLRELLRGGRVLRPRSSMRKASSTA